MNNASNDEFLYFHYHLLEKKNMVKDEQPFKKMKLLASTNVSEALKPIGWKIKETGFYPLVFC